MTQYGEVLKHCPPRLVPYSFLHNEDVTDPWVRLYRMASRRSIGTVVLGFTSPRNTALVYSSALNISPRTYKYIGSNQC